MWASVTYIETIHLRLLLAVGLVVMVHENTQVPLIEAAGIELAPGRKHRLGYKNKSVVFLPSPYSSCTNDISAQMKAMLENYQGADYGHSETICYYLCEQTYM